MKRKIILSKDEGGTAASIGTVLIVVLVAAMMTIVSFFVFGIVKMPEEPPEVEVVYSHLNDRWSAHVSVTICVPSKVGFRLNRKSSVVSNKPSGPASRNS